MDDLTRIANWLDDTELDDEKILELLAASIVAVIHRSPPCDHENILSRVIWSLEVMHKTEKPMIMPLSVLVLSILGFWGVMTLFLR